MKTSPKAFRVDLYQEHLEEASFLYEQGRALFLNDEISWLRIGDFQDRLEAHVDALVVGGELALDVCRTRVVEGDAGELFAAVCVFCRYGEAPMLAAVLRDLDYGDAARTQAVTDALKHELPDAWREHCLQAVVKADGPLVSLLSTVIGYRRLPKSEILCNVVERQSPAEQRSALWALGRTRPAQLTQTVKPFLQSRDSLVRDAALRAGLRAHDADAVRHVIALARSGDGSPVERGLAAGRAAVAPLIAAMSATGTTRDHVVALGLLGDLSAVAVLLEMLANEKLAPAAAEALYVVTGAPLFGDVEVPDPVPESEMFESERVQFQQTGVRPGRGDGRPFGTTIRRMTTEPEVWKAWLNGNRARFRQDTRYRLGQAYDPTVLLQCLRSESYPKSWRSFAAEELLIRYGVDLEFEPDMPVGRQIRRLRAGAEPVARAAESVDAGRWYLAGAIV